jgi:peptidoglycan hydrolase-like protein with peptidoglycan-binding domain
LKAIQKQNGLRETGIALPELQQLIFEKRVRNSKNKLVYTKTLPPIDGITMQEGDFGDAIYELHEMLVKSKHYDSNVGYSFTRATTLAVRAFQNDHKIKVTGKVDAFTLLALKTSIAVPADTKTPQKPADEPLTQDNVVIIRENTSGLAVTRLQQRLVELKYYSITPDGKFNSDDIIAVKHFQRVNNLPITGIADLATQQTLYTAYAIGADAQVSQPVQTAGGLMKIGSQGDEVRALQSRLITLKYLTGSIDGIFGTQTAAAVTSFQRTNNLTQDGIAGSQTLSALYSAAAKANQPAQSTQSPQAIAPVETSLKVGSTGSEVVNVQKRLIDLKYLTGTADGIYGPRTFLAVKEFQSKNKLDTDGIAGKLTITMLNSSSAAANNIPVIQPVTPVPTQVPSTPSFTAPRASEVRYANWYTEIRPIAQRLRNVTVYDFISGKHYNFRFYSLGKHADGTTLTAADTATMNSELGVNNWTPRPVWVIFSDGRVYMASTHSHGHETDYISGNDLTGHLCIHFPREMEEAALTGPYAVSHQNAILAGWDLTQNMAR